MNAKEGTDIQVTPLILILGAGWRYGQHHVPVALVS